MSNQRKLVFITFSLILILTTACSDQNGSEPETQINIVDKKSTEYQIYQKNKCLSCHGTDLEGRMGPLTNLQQIGARLEKEEIKNILLNGKEGTHMPAYEGVLPEENINILSDWLSEMK
ncbi:c-type cytochrome [Chengkuizengella sediminis]|uniref:c-type cytochrome n=1 Tax=Chengkuizengella sediminis TaxID=1885917 RepID=UPI00138A3EF1|nr:cytochrome c [Chengkuizengella sediminis]NDI35156.1 cytochrome c [Chengkuizengella sediminis]